MKNQKEIWLDVVGHEEFYQVSNFGRIRSKDHIIRRSNGITYLKKGALLVGSDNGNRYMKFQTKLSNINERIYIHRAVALAFIPNTKNKPFINHIDHNPKNNNVNNLEWCTPYENVHHGIKHGRFEDSFKMTNEKFKQDRELKQRPVIGTNVANGKKIKFESIQEAGRVLGGSAGSICNCCKGKRFTSMGYAWEYLTTGEQGACGK